MKHVVSVIAMAGLLCVAAQAGADDALGQSLTKRQLLGQVIGCMKKRMSASHTISYNEAAKACREQLKQADNSASGPLVAAGTTKP